MTHYVLLKLKDGVDADFVENKVRKVYDALAEELDYLNNPITYRSCVVRDSNADIMSVMELDNPECLKSYLVHPLHTGMANDLKDMIALRVSFDCE